jgi:hypothetical protein
MFDYPTPPFPLQEQPIPGHTGSMRPIPDHGELSYKGSNRLEDMRAVIAGGDSGIGRAVTIAYAREGADILIAYLNEDEMPEKRNGSLKGRGESGTARRRYPAARAVPLDY